MNKAYSITFNPSELDQLLTVLYGQTSIADQSAIRLIAKINSEVHSNSPLNANGQNLLSNSDLDVTFAGAEDTYRRYRAKHLTRDLSIKGLGQDRASESREMQESQDLPNTLDRIAQSLQYMMNHLGSDQSDQGEPLGFFPRYRQRILYCENQEGSYWSILDEKEQLVPLAAQVLTCKVKALEVRKVPSCQGSANIVRIFLSVQADQFYEIEIPYQSLFCKTLLLGLGSLSLTQLRSPLTIEPVRSPKHQSVICHLYYQGIRMGQRTRSRPQWLTVIQQIQQNLERVLT